MKRFCCGEVVPGCTAVFEFSNEHAVLEAVALHAHRCHGLQTIPPSLLEHVRSLIQTVPAV
jgi:predicted small metal-binding protein